tara:strand:- start:1344 stop:2180 length:837 start_codon:yes stop_codon:yes gene_type:complete
MNKLFVLFLFLLLKSCTWINNKNNIEENILARVGNNKLYHSDIVYLPILGDSSEFYSNQISIWIKRQLILSSAFQNVEVKNKIDRQVNKYREDLILFEFEKYLFSTTIKNPVSYGDIVTYYEENKNDFILPFNLVKALYAKIPLQAPSINQFRSDFLRYPLSDTSEIRSYCFQFAEKSFLEDSTWIKFDEIIINTPFPRDIDKTSFLKTRKFYEIKEEKFIHFIKILDKKLIGDYSPLSFEVDIINTILLNKRKQELFDNLRDSIFINSIEGVDYEIY